MRVICIESSKCDLPEAITVIKDSIYNVTEENIGHFLRNSNVWYTLLETGIFWYHSSLFREIDDIPEKEEEKVEIEELTN